MAKAAAFADSRTQPQSRPAVSGIWGVVECPERLGDAPGMGPSLQLGLIQSWSSSGCEYRYTQMA